MADKLLFSLVSPERELFSGLVDQVDAPGAEGGFGVLVSLEDTIRSFKALVDGEYDHLPEPAFYNVGNIEDAVAKAEKLAQEA